MGIKAHAKQSVRVSVNTCPSRFTKESRSTSSQKIFRRSIPRTMIWCSAPAASILAFRGISVQIAANFIDVNQYINTRPPNSSAIEGFHREGLFVVSWQNGIDTERVFADVLGDQSVMRAVVNYGCGLVAPGHVRMPFHHPPHYLQELDPQSAPAARAIADALTECGLATAHTDQIISMVWRKAILNACMNPVCAVTGMTMAQAMTDPIVFPIVDALVKECVKVARANEIELGWNFYPHAIDYMSKAGSHKPSMLMDIEARRRTEIDFINGKFVAYGLQAGIETPFNITLQALVKGLESQF